MAMTWKPVIGQTVMARLDGAVREVWVTAWDSASGAVRVAWPLQDPSVLALHPHSAPRRTEFATARYEPLDPDAFIAATRG